MASKPASSVQELAEASYTTSSTNVVTKRILTKIVQCHLLQNFCPAPHSQGSMDHTDLEKTFDSFVSGVHILPRDPLGPSFQQKKIELKSVHKQKS